MKDNNQIPVIFSLDADLKLIHGDTRPFTRNEALKAMIIKFQILRDFTLIREYMESVITIQGEKFFLVDSEKPAESVERLFSDLKALAVKIPWGEIIEWLEWRTTLSETLKTLHNSAYFFAYGSYRLSTHVKEADELVKGWIESFNGYKPSNNNKVKDEKYLLTIVNEQLLSIAEVARKLGCSRPTVYNKHIKKNGLKTVRPTGAEGEQKVRRTDLYSYMEQLV